MTEVTINTTGKPKVSGELRRVKYNVDITNGYTLTTQFTVIDHVSITPATAVYVGCSWSGGVITFASSGAAAGASVVVEGH